MPLLQIPEPSGHRRRISGSARTMTAVSASDYAKSVVFVSDGANVSLHLAGVTDMSQLEQYVRVWDAPGEEIISVRVQFGGDVDPEDVHVPGSTEACEFACEAITHLNRDMKDTRGRIALRAMYRHLHGEPLSNVS